MEIIGHWKGYYTYNNQQIQSRVGFPKTYFSVRVLNFDGARFNGEVEDDQLSGGTPGIGKITGVIENDSMSFVKQMPVKSILTPTGKHYRSKKKHPNIYYQGSISSDGRTIEGTWRFKFGLTWILFLPAIILPIKGEFFMEKS